MLHKNTTAKTTVFAAIRAAVIGTAAVIVLAAVLSACKHKSGGGGSTPVPAYAVTFGVEGSNGTLTAKVDGTAINSGAKVKKGKTVLFTATSAAGYKVKGWTLDGTAVNGTAETYSLTVSKAAAVKVSFESDTPAYAVTFGVEGANGTLTAKVDGTAIDSGAKVKKDSTVLFTAEHLEDYAVDKWTVSPASALIEGGTEGSTSAKIKVTGAIDVKVRFKSLYILVAYTELEPYLANTASADKVNYIEITGDIPVADFKGKYVDGNGEAGKLGQKIKAHPAKKVALKLPGKVAGLDSMFECFYGCTNLVSLANIPESVKDMENCFEGCTSLTQAPVIPSSVEGMESCFEGCTSLTQAPVIPSRVENMVKCFSGCTSLTKAPDIPASVTEMIACFEGCTSLTQAPDIPADVAGMESCFEGCTSLTQAPVIPSSVMYMIKCFSGCTSLTKAPDIPASVTDMERCFEGCSALKGVKLHCNYDGTDDRFKEVFRGCTALEEGGIKVKYGQYDAYTAPAALNRMAVPPLGNTAEQKKKFAELPVEYVKVAYAELETYLANTASADEVNYIEITGTIQPADFKGKYVGGNVEAGELGKKILAAAPKKVALKLPGKVAGLDDMIWCFYGCTNLVSLANIPESVKDMGGCFKGCTSLTQAPVISSNVTDMHGCFSGCTSLTKAPVIPSSVTNMQTCFLNCTSLTQAPAIPASVTNMLACFDSCTSLTQVPDIPASVWNMDYCFADCKSLTKAPDIPESVTYMERCFEGCTALKGVKLLCNYDGSGNGFKGVFKNCTSLENGGIKVKNDQLSIYKMNAAAMGTTAEKFAGF